MKYHWWRDQHFLKEYHLQSMPDHIWDATRFAYLAPGLSDKEVQMFRIDNRELEDTCMSPEDVVAIFKHHRELEADYVHPGPTTADLRHPSIRHAYEELKVIMMLARGKRL